MAGPSATVQNLFCSGRFEVMKNPGDVMNVGKLSALPHNPWSIRTSQLGRNPTNAKKVVKLAVGCHPMLNIM